MPLLVSFEGIDGSGKTSLVEKLSEKFPNSFTTKEPRGTELGKRVWQLANESLENEKLTIDSWSQFFLFAAANNEHVKTVIRPQLEQGKMVLVDRYIDSTFVYQGLRENLPEEQKKQRVNLIKEAFQKFINTPFPDLTFILDLEPAKAQTRLSKREEVNNWDNLNLEFHHQIRQGYLKLKEYFPQRNYYVINAEKSENEILEEVQTIIKKSLPKKEEKSNLPSFVRVIIQNEKGELLVIFEKKWNCWVLPGGKLEPNETPLGAAKREVFEETNLIIEDLEIVAKQAFNIKNQHCVGYLVKANKYSGEIKIKELEKIADIKFKQIDYEFAVSRLFYAIIFEID